MAPTAQRERYWHIRGYDSTTAIFDERIPSGQITERGLEDLLRALVARGLTDREIVKSNAKHGARIANELLEVRRENDLERKRTNFYCGNNPHFSAVLEPES